MVGALRSIKFDHWRYVRYVVVVVGIGVVEYWLIDGYLHPPGEDQPFQFVPAIAAALAAASFGYEWSKRRLGGAMVIATVLVVALLAATSLVLTSLLDVGQTDVGEPQGPLVLLVFLPAVLVFVAFGTHAARART